jgi:TolA-binding protein
MAPDAEALAPLFAITWTPTLIVLDQAGREHQRTVGFLDPDELIAGLLLGIAKVHMGRGQFSKARTCFDRLLKRYPQSEFAAEAVFFNGVNLYKQTYDPGDLGSIFQRLQREYPASGWCNRASPYSLL